MASTRIVHWNDQQRFNEHTDHSTSVKKNVQRISLSASLPFHSKLNIHIRTNRVHSNEENQVQTTATVRRLNTQDDQKHFEVLRQAYSDHYATDGYSRSIRKTQPPVEYGQQHMTIPASLSMNKRLVLYIRNGEIFARC